MSERVVRTANKRGQTQVNRRYSTNSVVLPVEQRITRDAEVSSETNLADNIPPISKGASVGALKEVIRSFKK